MRFPRYSQYFPSPCFLHILAAIGRSRNKLYFFSFLSTTLPRDDSLQWHYEERQRLFNSNDSAYVTPGRCDFIQGGVVHGYGRARHAPAAAMLLRTDRGVSWTARDPVNDVKTRPGGCILETDVSCYRGLHCLLHLLRSIDACFLKWAVASASACGFPW